MEYYVVRVYRRQQDELVGVVDDPVAGKRTSFKNREELWLALLEHGEGGSRDND